MNLLLLQGLIKCNAVEKSMHEALCVQSFNCISFSSVDLAKLDLITFETEQLKHDYLVLKPDKLVF